MCDQKQRSFTSRSSMKENEEEKKMKMKKKNFYICNYQEYRRVDF